MTLNGQPLGEKVWELELAQKGLGKFKPLGEFGGIMVLGTPG